MKKKTFIVVAAVAGIAVGTLAGLALKKDSSYCQSLEKDLRNNKSFQGAVACFQPGEVNASLSGRVENSSNLRCVCRKSVDGKVQWFKIAFSK